ncbi:MarR family winged helix-turn-helix transcriptional regulator [Saccharopolyspora phatthalungensis]|uniref:DNA-binding MarR family transcriptional regulator n=1 Tax=Saccharopolyspora phatthalungensis TaxID=664693 RepID=A0A840QEZ1_9PSEU|nr:MarR family transcriptional regulator [Saccharopolyspora phatthalungensis]MBB5157268.1 DNA-binding MarR family transcriptional regulator [Saccharopolyspora phatthalungensis]
MGVIATAAQELARLDRLLTDRFDHLLSVEGASVGQWHVLDSLAKTSGISMTKLSGDTGLTLPHLSKLVDRLVVNNLVYRRIDDADRRRVKLLLTPRGRNVHRQLSELLDRAELTLPEHVVHKLHQVGSLSQEIVSSLNGSDVAVQESR